MTPLTFEEIQVVSGGVNAGPGGRGCTEGPFPIGDPFKTEQGEVVQ